VTAAMLLLGALLAQGPGAKAGGGKKSAAPRSAEVQAKRSSSSSSSSSSGGESSAGGGGGGGGEKARGGGDDSAKGTAAAGEGGGGSGKTFKSKTYNFGAMDVEGKLKTPQLLYFLNRVKLELDMSAPDTRSFMKELEKSADDKNL
jgi:hypothetical protein